MMGDMLTPKKTFVISATIVVATLGLAACGDDSDDTTSDDRQSSQTPASSPTADDESTDAPDDSAQNGTAVDTDSVASALAAIAAAEEHLTGTAYEISEDDGYWEVDVAVGDRSHEVRVDRDGSVAGADEDDLDGDDRAALEAAEVTITDAIETAAKAAPGGRLDDVNIDDDGRGFTWEVSFEDGGVEHEVHVDAVSGEVVHTTTDD